MTSSVDTPPIADTSPAVAFWRQLMLVNFILGAIWIYVSRVPADEASRDRLLL